MRKEIIQKIALLFAFPILTAAGLSDNFGKGHVVINEICSNNFAAQSDGSEGYPDCIELYNPGEEAVSMDGCFLTDDRKVADKFSLEGISVPAGGYAAVWLPKESELRISKDGDQIFLADAERGVFLDQIVVPSLSYDTSYGRVQDGKDKWSVMGTTLGRSNEGAEILPAKALEEPIFEYPGGFYEEGLALRLFSPGGEKIYYTLDGSEPTGDSLLYEGAIRIADNTQEENRYAGRTDLTPTKDYVPDFPVDKAVVVRAVCYNSAANQISDIVTETFFVGYGEKEEYDQMAVMSLVADPEDLFDAKSGIYGNGIKYEEYLANGGLKDGEVLNNYTDADGREWHRYMASNAFYTGKEWEKKASVSYFDETHFHCFTQDVGIRIAGNSTRGFPQKSFNLFVRDIYGGDEKLPEDFFDDGVLYSSIKMRNGGGNAEGIKFLDAFLEEAASERQSVAIQRGKPCVLFLNGEYWGIYSIRERYNAEYIGNRFHLNNDEAMVVKAGNPITKPDETMEAYQYMLDVITECDLTYEDTYALAEGLVDIQSLIDYCCINLYLANQDVGFGYNTALWRTVQEGTPYSDGKWRFMLYDLDECARKESNTLEGRENWAQENALLGEPMVKSLLENEGFRRRFSISFMDIANTTFSYERIHPMLAEWGDVYGVQIVKDHQRFFDAAYDWNDFGEEMEQLDDFFKKRFDAAMESLADTFGLSGNLVRINISSNIPEGGTIRINTAELGNCSAWEGRYYSDFPISVSANAAEGYHFAGWRGDIESAEGEVSVSLENGDITMQAWFEQD